MAIYYVAKTGNDGNPGSEAQPKLTIQGGIEIGLSGGDTLRVKVGTYEEIISDLLFALPSGSAGNPIVIEAFETDVVTILQPAGAYPQISTIETQTGTGYLTFRRFIIDADDRGAVCVKVQLGATNIRFENCELTNGHDSCSLWGGDNGAIKDCDIHDGGMSGAGYGIYLSGDGNLIEGNEVHGNSRYGIHCYGNGGGNQNNIIRKNIIHDNSVNVCGTGILVGGVNQQVYNNLIYNEAGGGIQVQYTGPEDIEVYFNTIYNVANGCEGVQSGIYIGEDAVDTIVKNNLIINAPNAVLDAGSNTDHSNNLSSGTATEHFVDHTTANFHLNADSSAVEYGVAIPGITTDLDDVERSEPPDVGAYDASTTPGGGGGDGYQFKRTLTSDGSLVPTTQTNFRALFSITHNDLRTVANGGHIENTDAGRPADFAIFSDEALTTQLAHKIVSYNAATGAIVGWVKVPTLTGTTDTELWVAYGDEDVTTYQGDDTGIYDAFILAHYELGDGSTLSADDSSGNGKHGTLVNTPTAATGKINGGASFTEADDEYITLPNTLQTHEFTWSAWINATSLPNSVNMIIARHNGTFFTTFSIRSDGKMRCFIQPEFGGAASYDGTGVHTLSAGTWYRVTIQGSDVAFPSRLTGLVNGVFDGQGTANFDFDITNIATRIAGHPTSSNVTWDGLIDDVTFENTERSANWLLTEFRNQDDPEAFWSLGGEEGVPTVEVQTRDFRKGRDRAAVQLLGSLAPTVRDGVSRSDRAAVALHGTVTATVRDTVARSDRATTSVLGAFEVSTRDVRTVRDRASALTQAPFSDQMVILLHIYDYFPDGTPYGFSGPDVPGTTHDHVGKIIQYGSSEREIPIPPSGPPRISPMVVELDDADLALRVQFGARTPKYRKVDYKIGPSGGNEAGFQTPVVGVIVDVKFPPGKVRLHIEDFRSNWLKREMPGLVTVDTWPDMPTASRGAFAPIIFGIVSSENFGGQGAIKLIHIDEVNHRYMVARHPVESVVIWEKAIDAAEFSIVDESEYTLMDPLPFTINGVEWLMSFVEFNSSRNGAEIRADVHGNNLYGDWGIFQSHDTVSRNAIDHAFTLTYFMERVERVITNYEVQSWARVRQELEDRAWYADWAITQVETTESALTRLFGERHVHWFPNRRDQFYVTMIPEEAPADAPRFGDALHILNQSEMIELAQETKNRIHYEFAPNADGNFADKDVYDNIDDQASLLDQNGEPIIEEETLHLTTVRDPDVAEAVAVEWGTWRDNDAHRFRFDLDMPTNIEQDKVELARDFLATHYGGLKQGGWVLDRFVPYRIRDDYDRLRFVIDAIVKVSASVMQEQVIQLGRWSWNHLPGPWYVSANRKVFEVYVDDRASLKKMVMLTQNDDGEQVAVDDGVFPMLANVIQSSEAKRYGDKVYVATQEAVTGRVSGHIFDLLLREWILLNYEFIASNSHGDAGVSVVVRQPSNQFGILYQGDRGEGTGTMGESGPGFYMRAKFKYIDDAGDLSSEFEIGSPADHFAHLWFPAWGDPSYLGKVQIRVGRAIAELNDQVRFMISGTEPGDVASTDDLYTQILSGADVLSSTVEVRQTGGGENTSRFAYGDPTTFTHDGQFYTAVPVGLQADPRLWLFESTSAPGAPDIDLPLGQPILAETSPDTFGTLSPPLGVRYHDGTLWVVVGTRAAGADDWAVLKTSVAPFTSISPAASTRADQIGPTWPLGEYARHGFDIATLRGRKTIFKSTSGNLGLPGLLGYRITEVVDVATDVPGDNAFTVEDFVEANS